MVLFVVLVQLDIREKSPFQEKIPNQLTSIFRFAML